MDPHRTRTRTWLRVALTTTATAAALMALPPAHSTRTDPAALPRGDDPAVVHLVRDTIVDGDLRVPAPRRGEHDALWVVSGGYLLRDVAVGRRLTRLVYVSSTGERRVVARSRDWLPVEVSASGRRMAVQRAVGPTGLRTVITVSDPRSGRVVARRELRLATLAAVTDGGVLIGRRARWHHPATVWWRYRSDRLVRVHDQAALDADVPHDRVVFASGRADGFCNRVATLSRPARTLWHSCRLYPNEWSPDGRRAVMTYSYFDAAGTPSWWVVDGRTGERQAKVTGRLDKDAVWEDDEHFLTLAQSDAGMAAVIRCDLTGSCERASRVWDVPVPPDPSIFYAGPPVVLASP